MKRSIVVAIASLAPFLLPVTATAETVTLPPVVTLTSNDSSITATITNPNEPLVIAGYTRTCALAIDGHPDSLGTSVLPFVPNADPTDTTHFPPAGQTVTVTRAGLPTGHYTLFGECGQMGRGGGWLWQAGQRSEETHYDIWVGPKPAPPPAGSLGFGS